MLEKYEELFKELMFKEYMELYARDIANTFLEYNDNMEELSDNFMKWREEFSVKVWTEILKQLKHF